LNSLINTVHTTAACPASSVLEIHLSEVIIYLKVHLIIHIIIHPTTTTNTQALTHPSTPSLLLLSNSSNTSPATTIASSGKPATLATFNA
jgi:hypothetical protein